NYTLRARLKDGAEVAGLDLSKVVEARIEVRNPTFLLEELRKRFLGLALKDTFNMRDSLPDNIEFVYGPPGTGKTTYLARNVLIPLMSGRDDLRVLVLAPTNKAADVLARKIVECSGGTDKCAGWLIRFGLTEDPLLEGSGIYKDKTFDYSSLSRSVMVTTIARFPYDYFMLSDGHKPLRSFDWDYVVFDEAAMISCAQIVYPLYKANPRKFVVAGDPHQIAPVLKADLWQDENIYSMVELESFKDPHTVPHDYEVTLLTTQYRSVPSIGRVYGELSYDGLLSSHRSESDADRRFLGKGLAEHPINVVSFPVSPYESVYKPKRIARKSAYHPYSALLTYELVRHLASRAGTLARDRTVSIGVVSPYRAQADMLSGLIAQLRLDQNVRVQAGTIHGFQGDECDVMIVVLNTPPSISAKPGMFLNKRNILNVSVSRARDSLILLVPDENTRG
ncbi:MAG: AAA domain-containing protein, partial [Coriobacteriales bacterium]|nr:AAA domain-containing protein [Coriobacteriales bacterium]